MNAFISAPTIFSFLAKQNLGNAKCVYESICLSSIMPNPKWIGESCRILSSYSASVSKTSLSHMLRAVSSTSSNVLSKDNGFVL